MERARVAGNNTKYSVRPPPACSLRIGAIMIAQLGEPVGPNIFTYMRGTGLGTKLGQVPVLKARHTDCKIHPGPREVG